MASPAVLLLSGGLDSATTAAMAQDQGFELTALSIDYGQRHRFELDAAQRVAEALKIRHHTILSIDMTPLGASALTADIDVPKNRSVDEMESAIPVTYVPARNTVFLSLALGLAEVAGAADIFLGVNAVDYSGYPDCRPEYIASFQQLAQLATKAGVEGTIDFTIHAPLIDMTKAEIIRRGTALGVPYPLTFSCYDPDESGASCAQCDACQLRLRGFADAGVTDSILYQNRS